MAKYYEAETLVDLVTGYISGLPPSHVVLATDYDALAAEYAEYRKCSAVEFGLREARVQVLEAALREIAERGCLARTIMHLIDGPCTCSHCLAAKAIGAASETPAKPTRLPHLGGVPNTKCCPECGCLLTIGCDPDCKRTKR